MALSRGFNIEIVEVKICTGHICVHRSKLLFLSILQPMSVSLLVINLTKNTDGMS